VAEAKAHIAKDMDKKLEAIQQAQETAISARQTDIEQKRAFMVHDHEITRAALRKSQQKRWQAETKARQERFNRGFKGWLDRLTGHHRRRREENERKMLEALHRDQLERDALIFKQLEERRVLQARIMRLRKLAQQRTNILSQDRGQYQEIKTKLT